MLRRVGAVENSTYPPVELITTPVLFAGNMLVRRLPILWIVVNTSSTTSMISFANVNLAFF